MMAALRRYGEMLRSVVAAVTPLALRGRSRLGLATPGGKGSFLQPARDYAKTVNKKRKEIPSHLDDLSPMMLKKDYAKLPVMDKVDDVVRRMLSLEMASQKEKVQIKREQLADKVRQSPDDHNSLEVRVAYLTARICTLQEHFHQHPKDKVNRRRLLMDIDRRKVLLKHLRNSRYDAFERTCQQLGLEYVLPPLHSRRITHRWVAKKALCIKVFQEVQKLKAQERLKQKQEGARAATAQALQTEGSPV